MILDSQDRVQLDSNVVLRAVAVKTFQMMVYVDLNIMAKQCTFLLKIPTMYELLLQAFVLPMFHQRV